MRGGGEGCECAGESYEEWFAELKAARRYICILEKDPDALTNDKHSEDYTGVKTTLLAQRPDFDV